MASRHFEATIGATPQKRHLLLEPMLQPVLEPVSLPEPALPGHSTASLPERSVQRSSMRVSLR